MKKGPAASGVFLLCSRSIFSAESSAALKPFAKQTAVKCVTCRQAVPAEFPLKNPTAFPAPGTQHWSQLQRCHQEKRQRTAHTCRRPGRSSWLLSKEIAVSSPPLSACFRVASLTYSSGSSCLPFQFPCCRRSWPKRASSETQKKVPRRRSV